MSDTAPVRTDATMAVFLDLENLVLGAKKANFPTFDINVVLDRLVLRGDIVVKKAYSHFGSHADIAFALHKAAFELIELPPRKRRDDGEDVSGKNSADIRMVVDAMDLSYMKPHIDTIVIVSGDSDFSPLVSKLRENNKTVIGVGVKSSSSSLFIKNCDTFLYYDDFVRRKARPATPKPAKPVAPAKPQDGPTAEQAFEQVVETLSDLIEVRGEDQRIYGSMIKEAIKRKNPGFNERAHGFSLWSDLLKAAKAAGLIELEGSQANYIVRPARPA